MRPGKLGIIGGMGSRAGMLLFSHIIDKSPVIKDQDFIEVHLHSNSRIPDRTRAILYGEASPVPELQRSVRLLNEQQVDYIVSACVTSHYYYRDLQRISKAELLHPVRITAEHIEAVYGRGVQVGILATSGTIATGLWQKELECYGMRYITLPEHMQENLLMESIYGDYGLKSAQISQRARKLFAECLDYMMAQGADVIIGGCTDITTIAPEYQPDYPLVDVLDCTAAEVIRKTYARVAATMM